MPKITKIEVQKNNNERFNLYLNGEFEMGIDINTLAHFNLKKDQSLSPSEMANIQEYEQYRQAINSAITYISYRKRSEREVVKHLEKHDINESVIAKVIDFCYEQKLIDHEDYAESLKNTMIQTSDKGPEVYKQKLYQAGIENNIIDDYVLKYEEQQPLEQVIQLAEKIERQKKGPSTKVKSKVKQSLVQKGYTFEVIELAFQEMDFSQDEAEIDELLQKELEKSYAKYQKKYDGYQCVMKTTEALMRKGYSYDRIKRKLEESGIENDAEEIE
ncbi:recombination regulator RecX [Staphylococcus sp. SQ8-PEA]|uniref:Regulatory protein RecX n=1 Tax=Staphylococcus marylandisciuri TaxID=2981529 RepID=A0ABT2QQI3_9STAP|nr:recombination regulator RecX [Staphylococcus marylandisciuri]MCU5746233.1 recombination regulator RecX [Staphylococcus marylandisciuri]